MDIIKRLLEEAHENGKYCYAFQEARHGFRIIAVRKRKGHVEVQAFHSGEWIRVYPLMRFSVR